MTRLESLVTLNMVPEIGSVRLNKLLGFFSKPEAILKAPREKLVSVCGIGAKIADKIISLGKIGPQRELDSARRAGLRIMTIDDQDYPQNLKNIIDPPIVLYVKGALKQEDAFGIAIVGSRQALFYGLSCAEDFATRLSERGFTIISGMARGIDTRAHRGALKSAGRTVAVIGSGFNRLYPEENFRLSEEISGNGAVLSEFPMDTAPFRQNFPRRNRVISGLSRGVLVVEAARNSGALITADFALEQGRDVFALPGKVDSANSYGTNALIKDGAKLVSCVDDILEEFVSLEVKPKKGISRRSSRPDLIDEEDAVYSLLSHDPLQIDDLAQKTNLDIPQISAILLTLRLRKLIQELPGKQFVRFN